MENEKYLNDISEIKNMMNQSSRFISLSGFSGILAGIYALIASALAYEVIYFNASSDRIYENSTITEDALYKLLFIAACTLFFSVITAVFLSSKKALKNKEKFWNSSSKRLLINFMIPMATGGFFILYLLEKEILGIIAPMTLVFYGLACVNASKYTLGDVRYLGITLIILGLLSTWFIGFGLLFWALGFGVCHIIYGSVMYFKYDRD